MDVIVWLGIAIVILALVSSVLAVWMLKKRKKEGIQGETNYRTFLSTRRWTGKEQWVTLRHFVQILVKRGTLVTIWCC